jgi:two-component system response regulator TrcR
MKNATILLVEDEPFLAKVVLESLEKLGYTVVLSTDGNSALQWANTRDFSLFILDVMIPFKDGLTVASSIRQTNQNVPILFLTAKSEMKDVAAGYAHGGNDYLRKPFSLEELFLRIAELLKRTSPTTSSSEMLKIGRYLFSARRQELIGPDETSVKLSHRESELLLLLQLNRNEILDRKTTLLKLWGDDNFFNARNMDVYISKLRKKLKNDPAVEIVNIRGFGYKLICE